jgi:fimbrial chaperone protein
MDAGIAAGKWSRWICVLLCTPASLAAAGSLGVGPTLVELTAKQPVAVLKVRNTGDSPSIVQMETLAWHQDDGNDNYIATDELLATPEVFELAPGAQREVRVGLRSANVTDNERSYRVYVREVPPKTGKTEQQLSFAVRIGVPVFASRAKRAGNDKLSWKLQPGDSGCPKLALRSLSPSRQRISRLRLTAGRTILWDSDAPVYVLAGATRLVEVANCELVQGATELHVTGERDAVLRAGD